MLASSLELQNPGFCVLGGRRQMPSVEPPMNVSVEAVVRRQLEIIILPGGPRGQELSRLPALAERKRRFLGRASVCNEQTSSGGEAAGVPRTMIELCGSLLVTPGAEGGKGTLHDTVTMLLRLSARLVYAAATGFGFGFNKSESAPVWPPQGRIPALFQHCVCFGPVFLLLPCCTCTSSHCRRWSHELHLINTTIPVHTNLTAST